MRSIEVDLGTRSYPIMIERGLIDRVGAHMAGLGRWGRAAVVTNPTVDALYGERLRASLAVAGIDQFTVVVPDGEQYKSLEVASTIYDALIEHRAERGTPIVALGGGVVGDMAGFVAATYLRGVPFVQVPTTLLSQVDSSVGGKTAVNHPRGKNLIGAFYQPEAVFIDPDVLATLERREVLAGAAEVVKYGIIRDAEFFEYLEANATGVVGLGPEIEYAIERSCGVKAEVVAEDETEKGVRAILNLGHTFGHAIEAETNYRTYRHGEAVAIGMVMAAGFSASLGLCADDIERRVRALLSSMGLPVAPPDIPVDRFVDSIGLDKKVAGGRMRFVLIDGEIGRVVVKEASEDDLRSFLSNRVAAG